MRKPPPNTLNTQRVLLLITGLFFVATSVGSALYYGTAGGLVAAFVAPVLLLPSGIHWGGILAAYAAVASITFGIGSVAWRYCNRFLTYSFVVGVILLVVVSEYFTYLLNGLGSV